MKKIIACLIFLGLTLNINAQSEQTEKGQTFLDKVLGIDEVEESPYRISGDTIFYKDKVQLKDVDAKTFKYIGGDYGADSHHAYYKGKILGDAWGLGQFEYRGNGYASDGVHWYCNGKPVDRD